MGNKHSSKNGVQHKIILPTALETPETSIQIHFMERSSKAIETILKCVSQTLTNHIIDRQSNRRIAIFDEKLHPFNKSKLPNNYDEINPNAEQIQRFMQPLFTYLTADYAIVALIYIERLISQVEVDLTPSTWKRIVVASVVLASKTWTDQVGLSEKAPQILKNVKVDDLEELEQQFLKMLNFDTFVSLDEYSKYYDELRKLAEQRNLGFLSQPYSQEGAAKLKEMLGV